MQLWFPYKQSVIETTVVNSQTFLQFFQANGNSLFRRIDLRAVVKKCTSYNVHSTFYSHTQYYTSFSFSDPQKCIKHKGYYTVQYMRATLRIRLDLKRGVPAIFRNRYNITVARNWKTCQSFVIMECLYVRWSHIVKSCIEKSVLTINVPIL